MHLTLLCAFTDNQFVTAVQTICSVDSRNLSHLILIYKRNRIKTPVNFAGDASLTRMHLHSQVD